jgi:hypothetical protein
MIIKIFKYFVKILTKLNFNYLFHLIILLLLNIFLNCIKHKNYILQNINYLLYLSNI